MTPAISKLDLAELAKGESEGITRFGTGTF